MNNGARKVNFGEIRLKSISNITPITSRTNSVSQNYEEIDYNDEYILENGIMSIISENKRILTYQTTEERINELIEMINSSKEEIQNDILADQIVVGPLLEGVAEDSLVDERAQEIQMLDAYLLQLEQALPLAPYTDISYTDEYKDFADSYNCVDPNIDYDKLATDFSYDMTTYHSHVKFIEQSYDGDFDILSLVEYMVQEHPEYTIDQISILYPNLFNMDFYGQGLNDAALNYKYMTEDERMMYHYLFETEGMEAANDYMLLLQDKINQAYGVDLANNFLNTLDIDSEGNIEENLANLFGVSGKGLGDGILTFCEGLENALENNEQLTAADYEKIIILQTLQEKTNYLDEVYQFNSSLGNMLPSMATSAIISFFGSPVAGSITASALMGTSAYGNAKHQALTRGNDVVSSTLYGLFVGGSEATLGYFLGKIPGISQTAGLSLNSILQEGLEEATQEWVDAGLQAVILGEDVNWSEIPENARKSFIMGALMSGFTNGGQAVISLIIDGNSHNINVEETLEYMAENPDVPLRSVPGIASFFSEATDADLNETTQNQYFTMATDADLNGEVIDLNDYYEGTEIEVSPGIDMTSRFISVNILSQLLTDDSIVDKFNDFDNNIDFFGVDSKQAYIYAMEEYFNALKANGCPISEDMQVRYDSIVAQSSAIKNLNEIIQGDEYSYNFGGDIKYVSVDYLNSILFNDSAYNNMLMSLVHAPNVGKYDILQSFHYLYENVKTYGLELDIKAWEKLERLNELYLDTINGNRSILSNYSQYGANQNCVRQLALDPFGREQLYEQVTNVVWNYFPNMRKINVMTLLRGMDVTGICTYATVVNELLVQYEGREVQFREDFGYDLYRIENGQKVVNAEVILTDLYCFVNKNNTELIKPINEKLGMYFVTSDINDKGVSNDDGKKVEILQEWLNSKNNNLTWNNDSLFVSNLNVNGQTELTDSEILSLKEQISTSLANGHTLELGVSIIENCPYAYTMYATNSDVADKIMDDKDGSGNQHATGHSMLITGLTENGDLIVASWGREYILKFDEIRHRNIFVFESYLS